MDSRHEASVGSHGRRRSSSAGRRLAPVTRLGARLVGAGRAHVACPHDWTAPYGVDHGRDGEARAFERLCCRCGQRRWSRPD